MNIKRVKQLKPTTKLLINHKEHGVIPAFVVRYDRKKQVLLCERYLPEESRFLKNGPHPVDAADIIKVVREPSA